MPSPTYLLFDNSALNHLFGQSPRFDEATQRAVTERLADAVGSGALTILVNLALLGELAGLYFAPKDLKHERFGRAVRFVFKAGQGRLMLPFGQQGLRLRFGMEVAARGKAPYEQLLQTGRRDRWISEAFIGAKRDAIDKLAAEARRSKDAFVQGERTRKTEVDARLKAVGGSWADVFREWDVDPQAVIDEWTLHDMTKSPSLYGLPADRGAWPKPRELPTLWYARAYNVARLKEIGEGRAPDERGDLYDGIYFQDSVYADVFITEDDAIHRRAQLARVTHPRFLRTADWVAELTGP
jgi:hypothetical protein